MQRNSPEPAAIEREILEGTRRGQKDYAFDEIHDPRRPSEFWFQESQEGVILFVVFYTQACRWSQCLGCNLPARMSRRHIGFRELMAQIDALLAEPEVQQRRETLHKVIVSNNGSVLDEATFSSTALIYLVAQLNLHLPQLSVLSLETRAEYVDAAELEFLARALAEGEISTQLELAVGFEVFDDHLRNGVFRKGLERARFESLCALLGRFGIRLKCYFMLKPVPGMSDEAAVEDIRQAIDYLSTQSQQHELVINLHLNPTYAAFGTALERHFHAGDYAPPRLRDVARAALHAQGKSLTVFLGLSDEGLATPGGSFVRPGEEALMSDLESFNRSQDFARLREAIGIA
jgi:radical SAM enzyme (TIGR01210 family)